MSNLLLSTQSTLRQLILQAVDIKDPTSFSLEDCAHDSITQVANMAVYFQWMRECEQALVQCRYDRRALPGARNKFNSWAVSKLSNLLMKNAWKISEEPMTRVQRIKLESLAMVLSNSFLPVEQDNWIHGSRILCFASSLEVIKFLIRATCIYQY